MTFTESSSDPCVYLSNVLNEVIYGLPAGCERALEVTKDELSRLAQKIATACGQSGFKATLSVAELNYLLRCSKLCLKEIDEDEFGTRLGESVETAHAVNQELAKLLADRSSSV